MLAQIFSIEALKGSLLFKGGTSLSKAFGVIERFSEDIDLAKDYAMLGFTGARDPLAVPGTFKLTPPESRIQALRQEYRGMAVMIFGEPPPFEQIIETSVALENDLNALQKKK
jgi:hypothetical protein